jgi:hypothetical protein
MYARNANEREDESKKFQNAHQNQTWFREVGEYYELSRLKSKMPKIPDR